MGGAHQGSCPKVIATSTCYATRWPLTHSIRVACTSARPAGRCTRLPMLETVGPPLSEIFPSVMSVEVQTLP